MSTILLSVVLFTFGDSKPSPATDFSELTRLLQKYTASQMPKVYEDKSKWGMTVAAPEKKLPFGKLRKKVETENGDRLPHGAWKRSRLWLDDATRDVKVTVHEFRKLDNQLTRLRVGAVIHSHGEIEQQNWSKGLKLLGVSILADSTVSIAVECDVATTVRMNGFFPEIVFEPKVTRCAIDVTKFHLKRVGPIDGRVADPLGKELEELVRRQIRKHEPKVVEKANAAIAKSLREGKNTISMVAFTKLLSGDSKAANLVGQASAIAIEVTPKSPSASSSQSPTKKP